MSPRRVPRPPSRFRPLLRIGLLLLLVQTLALGIQTLLQLQKAQGLLIELTAVRVGISAGQLDDVLHRAMANGLQLTEVHSLQAQLRRLAEEDPEIEGIAVYGSGPSAATALFFTPHAPGAPDDLHRRLLHRNKPQTRLLENGSLLLGYPLTDPDQGRAMAGVWFEVRAPALLQHLEQAPHHALMQLLQTLAGVALLLPLLLILSLHLGQRWPLRSRMLGVALTMGLLNGLCLSVQAFPGIQHQLAPALDSQARSLARDLAGRIEHALALGIPFEALRGVDTYLKEALERHPEVQFLELAHPDGSPLQHHLRPIQEDGLRPAQALPVHGPNGAVVAQVRAWGNPAIITQALYTLTFDLLILFLATLVLLNEALGAILSSRHVRHEGAPVPHRLGLGRCAVFLLILSEEITRAFLPLYIDDLAQAQGLHTRSAISLPISAYMASFALLTPFAGRWAERWGVRRIFSLGCLLSGIGFGWALLDPSYTAFILARCLCAAGYAVGTMAMQQHFLKSSRPENRTRTLALFVGAVQTAAICGSPLGGMLAEQFGPRVILASAAGMSLLAWLVQSLDRVDPPGPPSTPAPLLPALRRPALWVPLLGAALPVKLVLAGFLFYLVPLALQQEAYGSGATGRAMMAYFLVVAALNPAASWLADRYGWRMSLVLIGGTIVGLGGLAGWMGGISGLLIGIVSLGLGTGLSAAALQAQLGQQGPAAMVLLRTLERLGSVLGPLVAGAMLGHTDYQDTMVLLGLIMLGATLGLGLYQYHQHSRRHPPCVP